MDPNEPSRGTLLIQQHVEHFIIYTQIRLLLLRPNSLGFTLTKSIMLRHTYSNDSVVRLINSPDAALCKTSDSWHPDETAHTETIRIHTNWTNYVKAPLLKKKKRKEKRKTLSKTGNYS